MAPENGNSEPFVEIKPTGETDPGRKPLESHVHAKTLTAEKLSLDAAPRSSAAWSRCVEPPSLLVAHRWALIVLCFKGWRTITNGYQMQHGYNTLCKPLIQRREFGTHGYDIRYSAERRWCVRHRVQVAVTAFRDA